jgi:hypothetical protein
VEEVEGVGVKVIGYERIKGGGGGGGGVEGGVEGGVVTLVD